MSAILPVFPDLGALLTECTQEDGGLRPGAVEARDRVRAAVFSLALRMCFCFCVRACTFEWAMWAGGGGVGLGWRALDS